MMMTETQYATFIIGRSTLAQTDLTGNDPEDVRLLSHLMHVAIGNINRTIADESPSFDVAERIKLRGFEG